MNKRICFSILNCSQDRKTNLFFHFFGESVAQQFCFEIYWPLQKSNEIFLMSSILQKEKKNSCRYKGSLILPQTYFLAFFTLQLRSILFRDSHYGMQIALNILPQPFFSTFPPPSVSYLYCTANIYSEITVGTGHM